MSETDLSRAIQQALAAVGVTVWRTQAGRVPVRGGWMHAATAGVPDLVGYTAKGKLLALEVKTPKGKERPAQTAFLERARKAGCVVGVVRSVDEAVRLVMEAA